MSCAAERGQNFLIQKYSAMKPNGKPGLEKTHVNVPEADAVILQKKKLLTCSKLSTKKITLPPESHYCHRFALHEREQCGLCR